MIEWTPPDGSSLQKFIAERFGWIMNDEIRDEAGDWIMHTYPLVKGVGWYQDVLDEDCAILQFETEDDFTMFLLQI